VAVEQPPAERRHYGFDGAVQVVAALALINVAIYVVTVVASDVRVDWGLSGIGVENGDWYRIVTAGFVHAGWEHLVSNLTGLLVLGLMLGNAVGPARLAVIYGVSLLGGSAAVVLFDWDTLTVGASGAVFGLAGAAVVVAWMQQRWILLVLAGGWAAANLLFTFSTPDISVAGHLGGFAAGALTGWLLVDEEDKLRPEGVALAGGAFLCVLLVGVALLVA
jgi:rhomboid protease GluP